MLRTPPLCRRVAAMHRTAAACTPRGRRLISPTTRTRTLCRYITSACHQQRYMASNLEQAPETRKGRRKVSATPALSNYQGVQSCGSAFADPELLSLAYVRPQYCSGGMITCSSSSSLRSARSMSMVTSCGSRLKFSMLNAKTLTQVTPRSKHQPRTSTICVGSMLRQRGRAKHLCRLQLDVCHCTAQFLTNSHVGKQATLPRLKHLHMTSIRASRRTEQCGRSQRCWHEPQMRAMHTLLYPCRWPASTGTRSWSANLLLPSITKATC